MTHEMRTLSTARNTINLGSVATFHLRNLPLCSSPNAEAEERGMIDFKGHDKSCDKTSASRCAQ
jgi:hypothetical protein